MNPNRTQIAAAAAIALSALLSACSGTDSMAGAQYPRTYQQASAVDYGVVDSIQTVQGSSGTSGAGAVAGGVVGGLLGNQVGGGSGRAAATAAGVVGGALAGNEIERNTGGKREAYQIGIRLNNGGYQTFTQDTIADLRVGDWVRVENGRISRY